jgi:hypothetical protein
MGEGFNISTAAEWTGGREAWAVEHNANDKVGDVIVRGRPPAQFAAIRERLVAQQRASRGVDYLFDIPIEVANTILPFRADRMPLLFGPRFTELAKT